MPPGYRRVVGGVALAVLVAGCGLTVFAQIAASVGGPGLASGTVFALVPTVPLVAALLWLDPWSPEPTRLVLFALGWGAAVAALVAVFVTSFAAVRLGETFAPGPRSAIFVAPFVEEAGKGLLVLLVAYARRHDFTGILDGIVYAGLCGVGFAFTENVVYFGRVYRLAEEVGVPAHGGLAAVQELFVVRGLTAPLAHLAFTAALGVGVGIAARHRATSVRVVAPVTGYLVACLAHMGWNIAATLGDRAGEPAAYAVLAAPVLAVVVGGALWARAAEGRVVADRLGDYAAHGWLAPDLVPFLASASGRRRARRHAREVGAEPALRATQDRQQVAAELALLRDKVVRGVAGREVLGRERQLLERLRDLHRAAQVPVMAGAPDRRP